MFKNFLLVKVGVDIQHISVKRQMFKNEGPVSRGFLDDTGKVEVSYLRYKLHTKNIPDEKVKCGYHYSKPR